MLTRPTSIKFATMAIAFLMLWSICISAQKVPTEEIEHVVVIGFDGLSPDGLQHARTPTFDKIIAEGASTMHARAVLPTSSSTNWASMIMGAGPEQHGITSNAWQRDNFTLPAVTQSEDFLFPTIFKLVDQKFPKAAIGAIYHWGGFGRLFEKSAVDYDVNPESEDETAKVASDYIRSKRAMLTFIHFDHVDHAGHEYGHGTPRYYESVEKADSLLKEIFTAIEAADISGKTLVIISADHGGLGTGHGGESLQEAEIPFIVWGPSVKKGYTIAHPVYQYDNAATVAFALGIKPPHAWIGKPVKSVFNGFEYHDGYPTLIQLKAPTIYPSAEGYRKAGGLFNDKCEVRMENPNEEGEIRYTLDGHFPTGASNLYQKPFHLTENTVVKSAIFKNGKIRSQVGEAYFRVKAVNAPKPVRYEIFYLNGLKFIPELNNKKANITGHCFEITSDEIRDRIKANTAVRFTSLLEIKKEGTYKLYTRSDDGSKLFIDGKPVVDNDGDHAVKEIGGQVKLDPGLHQLEVLWFNGEGDGWLDVFMESTTLTKQILPSSMLKNQVNGN
ncbi:alkaline phosphatase family protein [Pseudozobellia thermophila]|uniref:PA14 domain-containing protein n=1 Tax=Pseudozobellia thermophila TaxID=192903 RepID=A0A1M6B5E6_9FLAO|nr:alkaline phosphatase family protein [Pseudozobellia thermophila]SHI43951.1 PA14 domain-containing protein [Pseudozobellia thermophila]